MFKKFRKSDVSTQVKVKTSAQRGVRRLLADEFPNMQKHLDGLLPHKNDWIQANCKGRITMVVNDGKPLFFRYRDGPFFPLLRVLHRYPQMMPALRVDKGAIRFVLSGAHIMCPGLTSPGGKCDVDLPEGTPVAIYAEGKEHALAVGVLKMSTADIRSVNKGIGVEVTHFLDDELWRLPSFK